MNNLKTRNNEQESKRGKVDWFRQMPTLSWLVFLQQLVSPSPYWRAQTFGVNSELMGTIEYKGQTFETRDVYEPETELTHTVTEMALGELLINDAGEPVSDEARRMDEDFFYYCTPEEMQLSDEEILALVFGSEKHTPAYYYQWGNEPTGFVSTWNEGKDGEVISTGLLTREQADILKLKFNCPYP